jgi:hypothetical protein
MTQDEEISLYQGVIESQNRIIIDWPKEVRASGEIYQSKIKALEAEKRGLFKWLIGLVGFDVAIVILAILLL